MKNLILIITAFLIPATVIAAPNDEKACNDFYKWLDDTKGFKVKFGDMTQNCKFTELTEKETKCIMYEMKNNNEGIPLAKRKCKAK